MCFVAHPHIPKPPPLPHPREHIVLSAVPSPHEGTSYNPPVSSHLELLRTAHEKEQERVRKAEEIAKTKEKILRARHDVPEDVPVGVPAGMTVQELDDEEMTNELEAVLPAKKIPERKTKQERRKAEKRLAEVRPKSLCILGSVNLKIRYHPRNALLQRKSLRNGSSHPCMQQGHSEKRSAKTWQNENASV